ncbi:hypothetical protein HN747_02090 [archaeon]|jgi:hypothetical protein|nr:hypothetical protein [archaeon]
MVLEVTSAVSNLVGLSLQFNNLKTLVLFTFGIVIYSVFIFYFYRFLAKKNIINLDLSKFNKYEFGAIYRFFAIIFFIIEYIVILPFVTFFWFGILSILLLLLADGLAINSILLVSAGLVGAIRITSFVSEDLSRDLAKMIPLAFLGIALTTSEFFTLNLIVDKMMQIPQLISLSANFLIFIILVEIALRSLDLLVGLFRPKDEAESEQD